MDPGRWEEIQATFDALVELDPTTRASRLAALSATDPALRQAVENLLAVDVEVDGRLASLEAVFLRPPTPAPDLLNLAGSSISHFRVLEPLGAGGMGVVYRAEDTRLGRAVALKFLLPQLGLDAAAAARFLQEARSAARLDHPNLCTIHEVGESEDGQLFLAMALYPGETLKARLEREGPLPVGDALGIAQQIAAGLACAHAAGIVHRDLKPGNVMVLPDATVKILDFGLAKARGQSLRTSSARLGTPLYMAPEQVQGQAVDARTDLWALGVVLYEMLTGRTPFGRDYEVAVAHAILVDEPVPPATLRAEVPTAVEHLVLTLLQKDPARRYPAATALLHDLARVEALGRGAGRTARTRWLRATSTFRHRRQQIMGRVRKLAAGLAAVLVVAATTYGVARYRNANAWKAQPVNTNTVAVLPFRATATNPALANLGEMMMDLLFAVLTGDVGPRAVETGSLLREWNDMTARGEATASDAPLRLAAHFGAGLLLEGGVVQARSQLTVNAWLREVPEGKELARATVVGSLDSLGALPRRLVVALLGDRLGEGAERVASLADQDPQAVQAYLAGVQGYRAGAYRAAIEHYNRALARDSTFALAALALARTIEADVDVVADQAGTLRVAQRLRGRLSKRDQAELEALNAYSLLGTDLRWALAINERWVAASPDDPRAQQDLGFTLNGVGAPLGIPDWRSRVSRAWEAAWALDSVTPASVALLARWGTHMGDLAWLRRVGPQYLAVADTTTDWWHAQRWAIAIAQGDSATVRELRARAVVGDPRVANRRVAWTAMLLSIAAGLPLDDADLFTRQALARATTADSSAILDFYPVAGQALGRMRSVVATVTDPRLGYFRGFSRLRAPRLWIHLLDLWLMYPGLDSVAAAAAESLRAWVPSGREFAPGAGVSLADARSYPLVYRAARGDTVGVRTAARRIQTELGPRDPPAIGPLLAEALVESHDTTRGPTPALDSLESAERSVDHFLPHLALVARLRRVQGQTDRALAAARARFFGWGHDFQVFTPYLREEGYAAVAVGDTAAAIQAFTHYLTLKTDPDPGLATQERDEVRAALARLTPGGSRP